MTAHVGLVGLLSTWAAHLPARWPPLGAPVGVRFMHRFRTAAEKRVMTAGDGRCRPELRGLLASRAPMGVG